jgi:AraC family transcriptional regulator
MGGADPSRQRAPLVRLSAGQSTATQSRTAMGTVHKDGMAIATPLFESSDLYFAELVCQPDDPEWGEENVVTHPIVALPATPVWQAHDGALRTLMNANHAVFHHAGSEYHRERFEGKGYRCVFFFPSERLVREIAAELDPSAADSADFRFPVRSARLEAPAFALSRRLAGELGAGPVNGLRAREGLYAVLRSVVLSAYRFHDPCRSARQATAQAHSEIVEETKELITRSLAERVRLDDMADRLHVSAYHLARIFRMATGYCLHAYQTHLRLREGLDRLDQGSARVVGQLGIDLGFSSHSHFTASFRRTLGVRPSEVERSRHPGRVSRQSSRFLTA